MKASNLANLELEVAGTQAGISWSGSLKEEGFTLSTSAAKSLCSIPIKGGWPLSISKYFQANQGLVLMGLLVASG